MKTSFSSHLFGLFVLLATFVLLSCGGADPGSFPRVFWVSQPVNKDETMLITAGNLVAGSTTVELAQLGDEDPGDPVSQTPSVSNWTALTALTSTTRSLTATVPANWSNGVYALRLRNGGSADTIHLVNAPDPWFVQGDMGDTATPGGSFTVAGSALERTGGLSPQAALVNNGTGALVKKLALAERITTSTGYALRFNVPADVSEGEYQLWLHNGRGGKAAWVRFSTFIEAPLNTVTVKQAKVWRTTVFSIASYGGTDDEKFAAAIAAADANGGGKIYVPQGQYALNTQLVLPNETLLIGDGRDKSLIKWAKDPAVRGDGNRNVLVRGKKLKPYPLSNATFALEKISLEASLDFRGYVVERNATAGRSWMKSVQIKAAAPWQLVGNADGSGSSPAPWPVALYIADASNTLLDDIDLDAGICLYSYYNTHYLRLTHSVLNWRALNVQAFGGRSHSFLISGNTFNQRGNAESNGWNYYEFPDPGAAFGVFGPRYWGGPYLRDLLWAGNRSTRDDSTEVARGDVGYTSDGFDGIYFGKVSSVDGLTLNLAGTTRKTACTAWNAGQTVCTAQYTLDYNGTNAAGAIVQIIDGRGAGQWRYVTYAPPGVASISIDRPWDVPPDGTSTIGVNNFQGRFLHIDNDYALEPKNQEYFTAMDTIKAGNHFSQTTPNAIFVSWAGSHYYAISPAWHHQVLGNQSETGTSYISMVANSARIPTNDSFGISPFDGVTAASHVYRNNTQAGTAVAKLYLRSGPATIPQSGYATGPMADILVEHNQLQSIILNNGASNAQSTDNIRLSGVLLRGNRPTGGSTIIQPAAAVSGVSIAP